MYKKMCDILEDFATSHLNRQAYWCTYTWQSFFYLLLLQGRPFMSTTWKFSYKKYKMTPLGLYIRMKTTHINSGTQKRFRHRWVWLNTLCDNYIVVVIDRFAGKIRFRQNVSTSVTVNEENGHTCRFSLPPCCLGGSGSFQINSKQQKVNQVLETFFVFVHQL